MKHTLEMLQRPYESYREMVGYWSCGTPEIEIGEMHIIDATPDNMKPCVTNESDSNQQTVYLEEGHPFTGQPRFYSNNY
ncbi:unnamed protein product [Ranitomeya imitator]|uniref:Uncharacterized protein n=1 Tax=Ranitomeya imitator TaxID=111125 RepID=A0ABN9M5Q0_9NEOB|nr:unnamed protein product [Ranitomeya imitator]